MALRFSGRSRVIVAIASSILVADAPARRAPLLPEAARLDLAHAARRAAGARRAGHAAALDRLGERHRVLGPVDEAVRGDLVERVRLGEVLEQPPLAVGDHRGEAIEPLEERRRGPSSTPMWWKVAYQRASSVAHERERALEVLERSTTRRRSTGRSSRGRCRRDRARRRARRGSRQWPRVWPGAWIARTRTPPPRSKTSPSRTPCASARGVKWNCSTTHRRKSSVDRRRRSRRSP